MLYTHLQDQMHPGQEPYPLAHSIRSAQGLVQPPCRCQPPWGQALRVSYTACRPKINAWHTRDVYKAFFFPRLMQGCRACSLWCTPHTGRAWRMTGSVLQQTASSTPCQENNWVRAEAKDLPTGNSSFLSVLDCGLSGAFPLLTGLFLFFCFECWQYLS